MVCHFSSYTTLVCTGIWVYPIKIFVICMLVTALEV